MEELVRKCFPLSLRQSYARWNHISVHGGQPCFWPSTRRMQFKQGFWNVKRLLLRMMHRREVFPWEFRMTPLLDLQFLLLMNLKGVPIFLSHVSKTSVTLQVTSVISGKCVTYYIYPLSWQNMTLASSKTPHTKQTFPQWIPLPSHLCCILCFPQSHLIVLFHIWRDCLDLLSYSLKCWNDLLTWVMCIVYILQVRPMLCGYVCSVSTPCTCSWCLHTRIFIGGGTQ